MMRDRYPARTTLARLALLAPAALALAACAAVGIRGDKETPAPPNSVGRAAVEALTFRPLEFNQRRVDRFRLSNGVTVFYMEDRSLPLINLYALFRGGSSHFGRADLAAATAIGSSLLLTAGTATLPPDSVDRLIEYYALGISFSTGAGATLTGIETLTRHLDLALGLWVETMRRPRLDRERVEAWRLRQLEAVRRADDSPGSLAITEFNRLVFGDHPIGWQMEPDDLRPESLADERLRRIHRAIFCTDNMTLGIVGDISRDTAIAKLEAAFGDWPECVEDLIAPPLPELRRTGGVYVIQKPLTQSSIVMGQPGGVLQRDHPEYFAAQVANFILGGSGLTSRVATRVRSEEGLAYSAGTVWGAGPRHERIFGAFAQTRGETTIAAAEMIREILQEARREPPTEEEVRLAIDHTANGFIFAFENAAQIVTRQMSYHRSGLPEDWLERYLKGIQSVTRKEVQDVVRRYIRPENWTYVIIGDTTLFNAPTSTLGKIIER